MAVAQAPPIPGGPLEESPKNATWHTGATRCNLLRFDATRFCGHFFRGCTRDGRGNARDIYNMVCCSASPMHNAHGPRSLGQRAILCDPRRADGEDLLNARVKHGGRARGRHRARVQTLTRAVQPLLYDVMAAGGSNEARAGLDHSFFLIARRTRAGTRLAALAMV